MKPYKNLYPIYIIIAFILQCIAKFKNYLYKLKILKSYKSAVPIISIGNIEYGGTSKTPFTYYLSEKLLSMGFKPGIVSRGYGSSAPYYPYLINADDTASVVGDEPLLIAEKTNCPVMISPKRKQSIK